jgi:hypothetical protein
MANSKGDGEQLTVEIERLIEEERNAVQMGKLFNLYNKQIEKYQTQTQTRASWSFIFAIVAMVAGLALVVWGGSSIMYGNGWTNVAAGSILSAIAGCISAYITKTFLDVHRLSLIQLNHYFHQPVLNAHILTAQRLADQLPEGPSRQKAYQEIIMKVSDLISANTAQVTDIYGKPFHLSTALKSKRKKGSGDPRVETERPRT